MGSRRKDDREMNDHHRMDHRSTSRLTLFVYCRQTGSNPFHQSRGSLAAILPLVRLASDFRPVGPGSPIMLIDAAVPPAPAVELAGCDVEHSVEPPGADLGLLRLTKSTIWSRLSQGRITNLERRTRRMMRSWPH